ncbi:MAG: flagellar motor switch protein FliN [Burkholderiaceae bacterium]|nr:flagellar motor switch protein FliN [Burkholderiaceae bacterium]
MQEEQAAKDAQTGKEAADDSLDWSAAMSEQSASDMAAREPSGQSASSGAGQALFADFAESSTENKINGIDFILDIPVQLTVELGRTKIAIKNLLQLAQGSVVELDGLAGEPMDVLINGCLIAQGEVVVVNDRFGIRLTDIITPAERIRKLNR